MDMAPFPDGIYAEIRAAVAGAIAKSLVPLPTPASIRASLSEYVPLGYDPWPYIECVELLAICPQSLPSNDSDSTGRDHPLVDGSADDAVPLARAMGPDDDVRPRHGSIAVDVDAPQPTLRRVASVPASGSPTAHRRSQSLGSMSQARPKVVRTLETQASTKKYHTMQHYRSMDAGVEDLLRALVLEHST
ncbi:hypothetical protein SDRG_03220 [Saprolegnia diclina VS20]|uniref:Uncharacterized protein n=1 Tax=Saprolegnia diclina (strain VS20) TaxID=1156394 RepID=T0SAG0_SAPDV|nr:hypothetical protein SDRG_03220 [Saprolegnia diclina VS20]EQC39797.1 hypothetical protein SDRG_03220 [Saprolegnia diclina VS20]|eukprot:XP_008607069.1 hypothetical protein SDRG_03220 [Saprolegnia diclina VS20]